MYDITVTLRLRNSFCVIFEKVILPKIMVLQSQKWDIGKEDATTV